MVSLNNDVITQDYYSTYDINLLILSYKLFSSLLWLRKSWGGGVLRITQVKYPCGSEIWNLTEVKFPLFSNSSQELFFSNLVLHHANFMLVIDMIRL